MIALNAWPQPPEMSSMETWVVVSLDWRVEVRVSGVIWGGVVSDSAAIGVDARWRW